jgi:hypothetical protein
MEELAEWKDLIMERRSIVNFIRRALRLRLPRPLFQGHLSLKILKVLAGMSGTDHYVRLFELEKRITSFGKGNGAQVFTLCMTLCCQGVTVESEANLLNGIKLFPGIVVLSSILSRHSI